MENATLLSSRVETAMVDPKRNNLLSKRRSIDLALRDRLGLHTNLIATRTSFMRGQFWHRSGMVTTTFLSIARET
jgi:hypothetical protein